jgi:hypothetical protein
MGWAQQRTGQGMLIGVYKRFVFVANTKAASTSIEAALLNHSEIARHGTPERKHVRLGEALGIYHFLFGQEKFAPARFFVFGVMRDPLDWIHSWYRYRRGNDIAAPLPAGMDFAAFWAAQDWNIRRADGSKYLQRDMFTGRDGAIAADVIIPYDRLDAMFPEICALLGVPGGLPRRNVSRLVQPLDIAPALAAEMRDFYAEDYALWESLPDLNARGLEKLRADPR